MEMLFILYLWCAQSIRSSWSVLGPISYLLYTAPLAEVTRSYGLVYHFYADDTQLYISFKDCDVHVARLRVEKSVADICHWMDVNELKLNHDKTEIMLTYLLQVPYSSTLQPLQYR